MDSETTHFLSKPEASSLPCFWVSDSCSSMKGEGTLGGKKRRLSVDQVRLLEKNFNDENKLEHERKVQIAEEIGLRPRQVAVWFQNRRARSKMKRIESDYECLNAEYDKLKSDFDSLLNMNHELKAEVWTLCLWHLKLQICLDIIFIVVLFQSHSYLLSTFCSLFHVHSSS